MCLCVCASAFFFSLSLSLHVCLCVCVSAFLHVCVRVHVCMFKLICILPCTHACKLATARMPRMHAHTHTRTPCTAYTHRRVCTSRYISASGSWLSGGPDRNSQKSILPIKHVACMQVTREPTVGKLHRSSQRGPYQKDRGSQIPTRRRRPPETCCSARPTLLPPGAGASSSVS